MAVVDLDQALDDVGARVGKADGLDGAEGVQRLARGGGLGLAVGDDETVVAAGGAEGAEGVEDGAVGASAAAKLGHERRGDLGGGEDGLAGARGGQGQARQVAGGHGGAVGPDRHDQAVPGPDRPRRERGAAGGDGPGVRAVVVDGEQERGGQGVGGEGEFGAGGERA